MVNSATDERGMMGGKDLPPVAWTRFSGLVDYPDALAAMERRTEAIAAGQAGECVWLLEHPPLYTAGTSAREEDLIDPDRFPVYRAGRGGQFTYHGPGQRVAYLMLDLKRRRPDVRAYVHAMEEWLIGALDRLSVHGERREGRVGIWVARPDKGAGAEDKIAAIGVRLRRWVSLHGISLNVAPDLGHYAGIVPCGISEHGATSLADLGIPAAMEEVDAALWASFIDNFGPAEAIRSAEPRMLKELAPARLPQAPARG